MMNIIDNNEEESDFNQKPAAKPPVPLLPKMPQFEGWTTVLQVKEHWTKTGCDWLKQCSLNVEKYIIATCFQPVKQEID